MENFSCSYNKEEFVEKEEKILFFQKHWCHDNDFDAILLNSWKCPNQKELCRYLTREKRIRKIASEIYDPTKSDLENWLIAEEKYDNPEDYSRENIIKFLKDRCFWSTSPDLRYHSDNNNNNNNHYYDFFTVICGNKCFEYRSYTINKTQGYCDLIFLAANDYISEHTWGCCENCGNEAIGIKKKVIDKMYEAIGGKVPLVLEFKIRSLLRLLIK